MGKDKIMEHNTRVEQIKTYLERLSAGEELEKVRADFAKEFKEVDPATTARALNSVDASIINGNYAVAAKLNPKKDSIYLEPVNKAAKPYVNIIAVQEKNKDNKVYKEIVKAYQTEQTEKAINKTYKGAQEAAWPIYGRN